jgi:lysophospholipase L1-like esterase
MFGDSLSLVSDPRYGSLTFWTMAFGGIGGNIAVRGTSAGVWAAWIDAWTGAYARPGQTWFVTVGTNDAVLKTDPEAYRGNIETIAASVVRLGAQIVLIQSPKIPIRPDLSDLIESYGDAMRSVAEGTHSVYAGPDLAAEIRNPYFFGPDYVHLSIWGHSHVARLLKAMF